MFCFDENLNEIIQEKQSDICLRFICYEERSVQTHYFESRFLKQANTETISQALIQS